MPISSPNLPVFNRLIGSTLKLIFILAIVFSENSFAENRQQRLIKESAKEFLTHKAIQSAKELNASHYKVTTKPLDKNRHLTQCKTQLRINDLSQMKYGNQLLKIRCERHWDILVTGTIHIYVAALVSKKTLTRKHRIRESDINWQEVDISKLENSYLTRPEDVIGKYPNTTIPSGTPIIRKAISNEPLPRNPD